VSAPWRARTARDAGASNGCGCPALGPLCSAHVLEFYRLVESHNLDVYFGIIRPIAARKPQHFLRRVAQHAGALIVVCAWCLKGLRFKPTDGAPGGVSHGICDDCRGEVSGHDL
jgi:hypothetical protein